jgi:hypothetical protein
VEYRQDAEISIGLAPSPRKKQRNKGAVNNMETPIDEENRQEWTTVDHDEKLQEEHTTDTTELLTKEHVWNLVFCLLAWGFTVANVTMGKFGWSSNLDSFQIIRSGFLPQFMLLCDLIIS